MSAWARQLAAVLFAGAVLAVQAWTSARIDLRGRATASDRQLADWAWYAGVAALVLVPVVLGARNRHRLWPLPTVAFAAVGLARLAWAIVSGIWDEVQFAMIALPIPAVQVAAASGFAWARRERRPGVAIASALGLLAASVLVVEASYLVMFWE